MTKKQKDLNKLKSYAKALGLKVIFSNNKSSHGATWGTDKILTFYIKNSGTQKQLILNFLHELAHDLDYTQRKQIDPEMLYDALNTEDRRANKDDLKVDKSMRKLIYEDEKRACQYRQSIRKKLNLESVSEQDVEIDIKLDIWIYKEYYLNGELPSLKKIRQKFKEFQKCLKV